MKKTSLILGIMLTIVLAMSTILMAADQEVSNTNDSGSGSLRQAIADVGDGDEITFAVTGTITLTSGRLDIDKNMTITGPGEDQLSINGDANSNIFMIDADDDEDVVTITGLTITNGSEPEGYGGGIQNYSDNLTLENCTISGNSAKQGGGMHNDGDRDICSPILTNCTISGNSAEYGGGIMNNGYDGICSPTLTNCTISGNSAEEWAGGMCNSGYEGNSSPTLTNCTISGNNADYGGGMYNDGRNGGTCSPTLTNCILWGDNATTSGNEVYNNSATPSYSYCDVEGNGSSGTNKDSDPKFESEPNPSSAPQVVADHDLLLTNGSPCLGTGSVPGSAPPTDKDGRSRPLPAGASNVDMGAFEQYDSDASLPVELSFFTVRQEKSNVVLEWCTESEIENLGFILERRYSKIEIGNWEDIASYITNPELQGEGSVSDRTEYSYADNAVTPGMTYEYRLSDVSYDGVVERHGICKITVKLETFDAIPETFVLYDAYPNPFNPVTTISYQISEPSFVKLSIYDISGKLIKTLVNEQKNAGYYSVNWNARNVVSGIYIYRIESGKFNCERKCLIVK